MATVTICDTCGRVIEPNDTWRRVKVRFSGTYVSDGLSFNRKVDMHATCWGELQNVVARRVANPKERTNA